MKVIYFLLISILLTTISGCGSDDCAKEYEGLNYNFQLPVVLTPKVDTFHLGDTITLRSSFSDNVYDLTTDKNHLLEEFDFYPALNIVKIDQKPFRYIFFDNFNLYRITAENYHNLGLHGFAFKYKYEDHQYNFEMKFNVKTTGMYFLNTQSDLIAKEKKEINFPGKCKGKWVLASYVMNGNEDDNNFELLKEYMPESADKSLILAQPEERFTNRGGYVFVVVE